MLYLINKFSYYYCQFLMMKYRKNCFPSYIIADDLYCKSQYKNAQKSEYKNVQGSDIYSSGCASKKDRFSLRRYDGPLIETISE